MIIFFVGLGLFAAGAVLNAVGWRLHRRAVLSAPEAFFAWLLEVFRTWFAKLTAPDSTSGERVAAFGAILSALGLVAVVAGIVAWSSN